MENENINKKEESKEKKKETKYSVTGLITNDDINKDVMITTILNSQILGKLTRVGQYEIEILTKDDNRIIIFKHAIVLLRFWNPPQTDNKKR